MDSLLVATYIKTCHACPLTGQPNQPIKAAPLQPISASQPVEHWLVDCVCPLPKSKSGSQVKSAKTNLEKAQAGMKNVFLVQGDRVLAKFWGPCLVISTPDRRTSTQLCHAKLLKPHLTLRGGIRPVALVGSAGVSTPGETRPGAMVNPDDGVMWGRLKNSESLKNLDKLLGHLTD